MKAAALGILGCALLVAALAAFTPASLVDRRVAAATGGRMRVADAAGTVWNGRGDLADANGAWRLPVRWTVAWPRLAQGALAVTLAPAAGAATPRGTVDLTSDAATLTDVALEIPAATLASALPPRTPVVLGGTVALTAPIFGWRGNGGTGALAARWRDARVVAAGNVASLGTVDVALAPQGDRLAGRVTGSGGDVGIDGTVTIAGGTLAVDAAVTPQPSAPPAVARALAALGAPDGAGAVRLAWRGAPR